METLLQVLLILACLHITCTEATPSVQSCPGYVLEGSDLNCTCSDNCTTGQVPVTWPGHSDTAVLVKTNISRQENGTKFTCQTDCNGQNSSVFYTLQVYYPPIEAPVISGYTGQLLKHGDFLTCTVTGGYPLVTAVIFYCIDPKIEDVEDNYGNTSVTSPLYVNTSYATANSMTCTCTANWPLPSKYTLKTEITAQTEYRATVDKFTIKETVGILTVNESDPNLLISCSGTGRPTPNMTLTFKADNDTVPLTGQQGSNGLWQRSLTSNIPTARCEDMGVYTCTANNGFSTPNKVDVQLNVNCVPRLVDATNSKSSPPKLADDVLSFTLIAYPAPVKLVYNFFRDRNNDTGETVSTDMFTMKFAQIGKSSRVASNITLNQHVSREDAGIYGVSISNAFGEVVFYFEVIYLDPVPSVTGCPPYVEEGEDLNCTCKAGYCPGGQVTLTWPGHSDTADLVKAKVGRQHDGTKFTCQMNCSGVVNTTVYILTAYYGPTEQNVNITGLAPFPTDGTRTLNLTCVADAKPKPSYAWTDDICRNNSQGNTCSFTPRVTEEDDGKVVSCSVTDTFRSSPRTVSKNFTLDLNYPPLDPPRIRVSYPDKILKHGDFMNCSVTGGKPAVTAVIFSCIDPKLEDEKDEELDDETISRLSVNTTLATEQNMTCFCHANWAPAPELYALKTNISVQTEYKATLDLFTINDTTTTLTVKENDTNLSIICSGTGRLAPNLTLNFLPYTPLTTLTGQVSSNGTWQRIITSTIPSATCRDTGLYSCIADNGFADSNKAEIQLNVNCTPRLVSSPNSKSDPPELKTNGMLFTLLAYPVPDRIVYTFYGDQNNDTGEGVSSSMFNVTITRLGSSARVEVNITHNQQVMKRQAGVYSVQVSNDLGGAMYYFKVINREQVRLGHFTINGTSSMMTVKENDTMLTLSCEAAGQPAPTMTLTVQSDKDMITLPGQSSYIGSNTTLVTYSISEATCQAMGTYRCTAANEVPSPVTELLQLNVNCTPRFVNSSGLGTDDKSPGILTSQGLNFTVAAFPVPDKLFIQFSDKNESHTVSHGIFTTTVNQVQNSSIVLCGLTLVSGDMPENYRSEDVKFSFVIGNDLGGVNYHFILDQKAGIPAPIKSDNTGAIIGGCLGAAAFLIIVIIIIVLIVRRRYRKGYTKHTFSSHDVPETMQAYDNISPSSHGVMDTAVTTNNEHIMTGYANHIELQKTQLQKAKEQNVSPGKEVRRPEVKKTEEIREETLNNRAAQPIIEKHEQPERKPDKLPQESSPQNRGEQSQQNKGEQSQQNKGEQAQQNKKEQPQQNKGGQPEQNKGDQPQQNKGEHPQHKKLEHSQQNTEEQPQQTKAEQPQQNKGEQTRQNKGEQTQQNKENQPQSNNAGQPRQMKENQPQQMTNEAPLQNKADQPEKPIGHATIIQTKPASDTKPKASGLSPNTHGYAASTPAVIAVDTLAAGPFKTTISTGPRGTSTGPEVAATAKDNVTKILVGNH